jgi:S-DNA-T family DNA segregation ATPase FtsK/SpoIIIE
MARTDAQKKNSKRVRPNARDLEEKPSIFSSMEPETIRGIIGVFFFVLAILLILSALGMAGVAGEHIWNGIYWLVGVGYFLLPLMLGAWAVSLFNKRYRENALRPLRMGGAILFFLASLGTVAVITEDRAGILGVAIARPLLAYLDIVATLVILTGLVIVALLLLFDSELWVILFRRLVGLFKHPQDTPAPGTDDASPDRTPYDEPSTPDTVAEDTPPADVPTEEPEVRVDAPADEFDQLFESKRKGKKEKPGFVIPSEYIPPPLSLLESDRGKANVGDTKARANLIRRTLQHFKIPVEMDEIVVGPSVTRYSLKPAEGVRLNKIVQLQQNLELALAASPIRIEAPIPGKSLVGIEVPNTAKSIVGLAGLLSSPEFTEETVPLFVTLGKDIAGSAHYANIGKMPHALVAGTTGSGKSVMMHSIITSLLYRNGPERLRFIMVDPKRVELTLYNDIPHLLTPVITDAKKCILSLKWAAKEMDRRYDILQEHKVQDISTYHEEVVVPAHKRFEKEKSKGATDFDMPDTMPHIVIMIDELADIMSAYPRELEAAIVRLAQMSRAVGIHLILSTQRPEVKVITGLIKANIPTRIALKVATNTDSRTILDQSGAEKLLGYGDMLYLGGDMAKPRRIQSPFITNAEVKKVVQFLKQNNTYNTLDVPIDFSGSDSSGNGGTGSGISFAELEQNEDRDDLYTEVRSFVIDSGKASTSLIQRRFKVGYGRAARIMDQLEDDGVIAGQDGTNRPREVLGAASYPDQPEPSDDATGPVDLPRTYGQ